MSDIGLQNALVLGAILVGAVIAFWILRKVVKFVVTLVGVACIAAVIVSYCVWAGYLPRDVVERFNPFGSAWFRQTFEATGAWTGAAVRKGVGAVVDEALGRAVPKRDPVE